jgi:long-chain acyl-CoA synthetase
MQRPFASEREIPRFVIPMTIFRPSLVDTGAPQARLRAIRITRPPLTTTFPQLLLEYQQLRPTAVCLREKALGIWQEITWDRFAVMVRNLAMGFVSAGVERGSTVAIIGDNRPRLYASLAALQCIGAIPIPLYQDATCDEYVFPLNNAEVAFAIAEDQEQVDKLLEVRAGCASLRRIWFDDVRGLRNYGERCLASLDSAIEAGRVHDEKHPKLFSKLVSTVMPDDAAAIFFTSGTTGQPKGVVHTHRALIDRSAAGSLFDRLTEREEVLAYLPPAWIGQHIFSYAQWLVCGYIVNCPESPATVAIDMKEIGPTYYFAPPRVFEGLLTSVMTRMEDAAPAKRWLFRTFMELAKRIGPARMDGRRIRRLDRLWWTLGDLLVFGPLRNTLGMSRVRVAYTAGEAIGPDLFAFYRSIGINLKQLYGSTETAVFVCLQPDHAVRVDTVGVPIGGVELQVMDNGEVLVRSPGLLQSYFKNPDATRDVLTAEGWYRTGDAGFLDSEGQLRIIDRAKDVGRLSHGALFAPKYIENKLKFFPFINEAVAFGNAREQVCAFINIDFEAVGNWAERRNLPYTGYIDLSQKDAVRELVRECIEKVNADLAADERMSGCQVARFVILHKELDADDGELTRTRKVRRNAISEKYAQLIDALYAGSKAHHVQTAVRFEDGSTSTVSADLRLADARVFEPLRRAA